MRMLASPKPAEKYGLPSSVARGLKPPRPRPEEPDDALAAVAAVGSVEAAAGAASGGGGIATAVALRCRGSTNSWGLPGGGKEGKGRAAWVGWIDFMRVRTG